MPTARVSDIAMYYEIHGEGEPLVLIAGLASDHTLYRTFIPRLATKFSVIAFDNRGSGQTDKPDAPYSIEMMADDTAELLHAIGIQRAHILGTSMGGRIAVALALRHPELVRSLILISTAMKPPPVSWPRRLMSLSLLQFRIPRLRGSQPYSAVRRQREALRNFDATKRLHELDVPTLILHGKRDGIAPYRLAEEMHSSIRASRMITFGGGHLFFLTRQQQTRDAIATFLATVRE